MSPPGPRRRFIDSISAQTLIALSFNIISLFAGGLISLFTPQFQAASWILALFPPILTIRGGIGGIFSGNLATMLHLGFIKPQIRDNTPLYRQLISAVFSITLIDTLAMGLFSFTLNAALGKVTLAHLPIFVVVPPVACSLAMALSIPLTSVIAIATFRRGLDPDILVYPILASVNDIVVTAAYVSTVLMVLWGGAYMILLWALFLAIIVATALISWQNRRVKFFFQTIREGTTVVIMSSLFGSVNGVFLSGLSASLLRYPGVMVLYPALTNALGNIGSIIGSTTTTSLALGYIRSLREEVREAATKVLQIEAVAFGMHAVFALTTYLIAYSTPRVNLGKLMEIALLSNLISFIPISLVSLAVAHQAFKRGLNPDNVVIPIITTMSDTTATLTLIPVIMILKGLGLI